VPKPKRINQAEIAKKAGVSVASVSLILRGGVGASAKTTKKVMDIAHKMGYSQNALVRGIRSGRSRSIGVLIHPYDSYWMEVLTGVHDQLLEADYLPLTLWNSRFPANTGEEYGTQQIQRLLDRWVDGVILWPQFATYFARHLLELEKRNIPIVTIDHTVPLLSADTVESDELQLAQIAIDHLAKLGHKTYLVLSGPDGVGWADRRSKALVRQIANISGATSVVLRCPYDTDISEDISALLRRKKITAAISCTDHLARQIYCAASRSNVEIPTKLSVVSVNNLNFAEILNPPLTSISQDGYMLGRKAASVELDRVLDIVTGNPRMHKMPVKLIERKSTGPAN